MSWKDSAAAWLLRVRASERTMARRRWKRGPVVVERVCGGAAGAVDGGVVDAGEADGLGGVAKEASDGGIAGAGRLGDEKVRAVAFGDAVGVGARLA